MLIVGIDCARDESKIGLALARVTQEQLRLVEVRVASHERRAALIAADWLKGVTEPVLMALDAPLGWPAPNGKTPDYSRSRLLPALSLLPGQSPAQEARR